MMLMKKTLNYIIIIKKEISANILFQKKKENMKLKLFLKIR